LTTNERVQAIADYGFTERQARFLVLVMRHSGLCVKRQYGAFAGIAAGGDKCNAFFDKLVRRGYAVSSDCIHNRARLYHVHHKPLYQAVGEPESPHRRSVPARRAAERLMRVDAALIRPDLEWLTTTSEKLEYLAARIAPDPPKSLRDSQLQRQPELLPRTHLMGTDATGRLVLLYLATVPSTDDFRLFLVDHVRLFSVTPTWLLHIVFPRSLQRVVPDYQRAAHEEVESPLCPNTINDLQWYFFHCRRKTDWSERPEGDASKVRFIRCAKAFAGPRFTGLYRRWLREREACLSSIPPLVAEAFTSGRASVECTVLPHTYQHLSPLVSPRRSRRRRLTADATKNAKDRRSLNPTLNPVP
jgi:hypothetical protein